MTQISSERARREDDVEKRHNTRASTRYKVVIRFFANITPLNKGRFPSGRVNCCLVRKINSLNIDHRGIGGSLENFGMNVVIFLKS